MGWIADEVWAEFPELRLVWLEAPMGVKRDSRLAERLHQLSNRLRGEQAISMRRNPVAHAYRVLYRHMGLDPDTQRPPAEAAIVERLLRGQFRSRGAIEDALLISLVETGVPIWAADAQALHGELGIRTATAADTHRRGARKPGFEAGDLVVCDFDCVLARLFAELSGAHQAGAKTRRVVLFCIQAPGVPDIFVDEALSSSAEMLQPA